MTIRLADCDGQRNRANMLLNRMYSWRGYGADHRLPTAPNSVIFTAMSGEDMIGTLTLTWTCRQAHRRSDVPCRDRAVQASRRERSCAS